MSLRLIISDDVDGIVKENVTKKWEEFQFSPVNFIFEHVPCRFVLTQRIVPQDLLGMFFFLSSILKSCFLWQCYQCELILVITKKILFTWACANRRFDFWYWLSFYEVPSTQTQDNFVSDVFFCIIVTLAWFWLCKTWLFPRFMKYVIKIHVAKVAHGVLHLNFL